MEIKNGFCDVSLRKQWQTAGCKIGKRQTAVKAWVCLQRPIVCAVRIYYVFIEAA